MRAIVIVICIVCCAALGFGNISPVWRLAVAGFPIGFLVSILKDEL